MAEKKYKRGYTTGVYDLFHVGHLNILRRAKAQCEYLVVGVTTDELCMQRKHKAPLICEADRLEIIRSVRYVDEAVLQRNMDKLTAVREHQCDVVFVGSDWQGTASWQQYERELAQVGCEVVYLPHTDGISSSILRESIYRKNNSDSEETEGGHGR